MLSSYVKIFLPVISKITNVNILNYLMLSPPSHLVYISCSKLYIGWLSDGYLCYFLYYHSRKFCTSAINISTIIFWDFQQVHGLLRYNCKVWLNKNDITCHRLCLSLPFSKFLSYPTFNFLKIHFGPSFIIFGQPKYVLVVFVMVIWRMSVVSYFFALLMPLENWIFDLLWLSNWSETLQ